MRSFRERSLRRALISTGITPRSVIMVHSALFALGRIKGLAIDALPRRIYDILRDHFGDEATIVVPTFNFDYCRGMEFNRQYTPSQNMGVFSEYVRQLPEARRSPHPMQSIAAIGPLARDLTERDTPGAFDEGSSFDALLDHGAHILMLGCGIDAVSLVHWAEQKVGVPYRYWKEFSAPYRDDRWVGRRTYRMYVRDLDLDPTVHLDKIGHMLRRRGELRRLPVGDGSVESCRGRHFASVSVRLLQKDSCALIRPSSPPKGCLHATT